MHYKVASLQVCTYAYYGSIKPKKTHRPNRTSLKTHFFLGIKEFSTTLAFFYKQQNSVCSLSHPAQLHSALILMLHILCNILHYLLLKKPTTCTYKTYKIHTYTFLSACFSGHCHNQRVQHLQLTKIKTKRSH